MTKHTTVFTSLLRHLSRSEFEKAVRTHQADKGVRTLSTFDWRAGVHTPELAPENLPPPKMLETNFRIGAWSRPVQ
jgi:hypothetical protein